MLGFHLWELIVVLVLALMFFGPKRLPELGSSLGKSIREFRKSTSELRGQTTDETTATLPAAEQSNTSGGSTSPTHAAAPHAATAPPRDKEAMHT